MLGLTHSLPGMVYSTAPAFSPADVSGLLLWLETGSSVQTGVAPGYTTAAVGDPVSRWRDLSAQDNHALQGTTTSQPQYTANGVLFDGSDDWMQAIFTLTQPCTVFLVGRYVSATSFGTMLDGGTGAEGTMRLLLDGTATDKVLVKSVTTDNANPVLTNVLLRHVYQVQFNGASSFARVDGITTAVSVGTGVPGGILLGARNTLTPSQNGNILLQAVLIYQGALPSTHYTSVETYLAQQYGVTLP